MSATRSQVAFATQGNEGPIDRRVGRISQPASGGFSRLAPHGRHDAAAGRTKDDRLLLLAEHRANRVAEEAGGCEEEQSIVIS